MDQMERQGMILDQNASQSINAIADHTIFPVKEVGKSH
jgi:hypothetical protein